jgi:hypothetical protein
MNKFVFLSICLSACSDSNTGASGDGGTSNIVLTGEDATATPLHSPDSGVAPYADSAPPADCTEARRTLIGAVDSVASGAVRTLSHDGSTTTLYVDASAGGPAGAASNPWLFLDLGSGEKVPVTDATSLESTAWDLALKRPLIYTNGGDGGPGMGGADLLPTDFDAVTTNDAIAAIYPTERFLDRTCAPLLDANDSVMTTFSSWYDYDAGTHVLSPAAGTWLVRGATGKHYKLRISSYYATEDGGTGMAGGAYLIEVGAL